jgi:hypothetical protein
VIDCLYHEDGLTDLGSGGRRWKDLYLSGGVYVGGTAAANKFDDYEEGTWTVSIEALTSNPSVTYTTRTGWYTKVGNVVNVWFWVEIATISGGSGVLAITDLPFTAASGSGKLNFGTAYANDSSWGNGTVTQLLSYIPVSGTYIRLVGTQNGSGDSNVSVTELANNDIVGGQITYTV